MGTGAGVGTSGHGSTSSSSSIGVQSDSTSRADAETQDSTQRSTADGWTTNDNDFVGTQTTAVEAGNIDEETAEDNLKQKHKQVREREH